MTSSKKDTAEIYATSQLERAVSISLEKPQAMLTRNFSRISKILYFVSTQLPLPHIKIDPSVKQAMRSFLDETWKEVEDYYSEVENEYTNNYKAKLLPLDGYLSLKSSSEKQFNLVVHVRHINRRVEIVSGGNVFLGHNAAVVAHQPNVGVGAANVDSYGISVHNKINFEWAKIRFFVELERKKLSLQQRKEKTIFAMKLFCTLYHLHP